VSGPGPERERPEVPATPGEERRTLPPGEDRRTLPPGEDRRTLPPGVPPARTPEVPRARIPEVAQTPLTPPAPGAAGEAFAVPFVKALAIPPGGGRFLLQRRAKTGDPYCGFWELPGGRMRWGETIEAALRREIREETGLRLLRVLGPEGAPRTDRFGRTARRIEPLAVVEVVSGPWPFVGLYFACATEGDPAATEEGEAHRYVTPEEFRREFLEPGAAGACATLDLTALEWILGQATPPVLR